MTLTNLNKENQPLMDAQRKAAPQVWAAVDKFIEEVTEEIEPGKHPLEGGAFANVQEYTTAPEKPFEFHEKFIDIQFLLKGTEKVFLCARKDISEETKAYDEVKDVALYAKAANTRAIVLEAGKNFGIFFPQDVHAPGCANGDPAPVKKVIVKIPVK